MDEAAHVEAGLGCETLEIGFAVGIAAGGLEDEVFTLVTLGLSAVLLRYLEAPSLRRAAIVGVVAGAVLMQHADLPAGDALLQIMDRVGRTIGERLSEASERLQVRVYELPFKAKDSR